MMKAYGSSLVLKKGDGRLAAINGLIQSLATKSAVNI